MYDPFFSGDGGDPVGKIFSNNFLVYIYNNESRELFLQNQPLELALFPELPSTAQMFAIDSEGLYFFDRSGSNLNFYFQGFTRPNQALPLSVPNGSVRVFRDGFLNYAGNNIFFTRIQLFNDFTGNPFTVDTPVKFTSKELFNITNYYSLSVMGDDPFNHYLYIACKLAGKLCIVRLDLDNNYALVKPTIEIPKNPDGTIANSIVEMNVFNNYLNNTSRVTVLLDNGTLISTEDFGATWTTISTTPMFKQMTYSKNEKFYLSTDLSTEPQTSLYSYGFNPPGEPPVPIQYTCKNSCINRSACNASTGQCDCAPGWTGPNCGMAVVCDVPCQNGGICSAPNTCTCLSGWSGPDCGVPVCSVPCKNGGACSAPNTCTCNAGWSGPDCGIKVDPCPAGGRCFKDMSWPKCSPSPAAPLCSAVARDMSKTCCLTDEIQWSSAKTACPAGWRADINTDYCTSSAIPWALKYRMKCVRDTCPK